MSATAAETVWFPQTRARVAVSDNVMFTFLCGRRPRALLLTGGGSIYDTLQGLAEMAHLAELLTWSQARGISECTCSRVDTLPALTSGVVITDLCKKNYKCREHTFQ